VEVGVEEMIVEAVGMGGDEVIGNANKKF